jgi:hypothetical protein
VTPNDPARAVELATLALQAHRRGQAAEAACLASRASSAASSLSRAQRQQVEVICLAVSGECERAFDLAAEHLAEYPDDELVREVQRGCGG